MLTAVVDFPTQLENYRSALKLNNKQINEVLSIGAEVLRLIKLLEDQKSFQNPLLVKPRVNDSEYKKLARVLNLSIRYRSDINSIAMDIVDRPQVANRLLQTGIDYIFENLEKKDFKMEEILNPIEKEPVLEEEPEPVEPVKAKVKQQKTSVFAITLFFIVFIIGGYFIYSLIFNRHATEVASLMHEYRSDRALASDRRSSGNKLIKVYGSGSLITIISELQNKFLADNPDLRLEIKSVDSAQAIDKLLDGEISIAASSRMPNVTERKRSQAIDRLLADHKVAMDAVAVFVHPSNPISEISIEQLKSIYSSDSVNWQDYGGFNNEISRLSKTPNSGTFAFFKERVLFTEEVSDNVIKLYETDQLVQMVENNPNAIAFASMSNLHKRNIKVLKISTLYDEKAVSPIDDNGLLEINSIKRGDYPLTRYVYFITAGNIDNSSARLIDYIRSPEGQRILTQSGLVSIY